MFQATRRRLALWYTTVTAVLLLLFASGFYLYVRSTLVERVDDTLNHVVEIVQRSLVIERVNNSIEESTNNVPVNTNFIPKNSLRINVEASFRDNASAVEDDHIDLEWFSPTGDLLWSTLEEPLDIPLHANNKGETVHLSVDHLLRQVTKRIEIGRQVLGYLRVSHPWFEVTKPSRQLILDLSLGTGVMVLAVAAIGWFLSGLAMAPVRDSYQRLKQFTADASHELRNPIAVIQTNVQVALADPEPDLQFQRYQLKVVERLTRRLGRLVDDLLFLARQDSGIVQMRWQLCSLDTLLADVIEEQQAIAADKSIALFLNQVSANQLKEQDGVKGSVETSINDFVPTSVLMDASDTGENLFSLQADRDQMFRLFTNLISNAVQYTPSKGQVHVELQQVKHHGVMQLQVRVRDTGVGIPEEALPHLFDRFYRVDPARTHSGTRQGENHRSSTTTGSGLGLAIAQAIVENHRGHICIDSILNQGTTVLVTLPYLSADFVA